MLEKLIALLAAFGTGANKGFWVVQPRDDEGQWMEMGRGSLTFFRLADGTIVEAVGTFIGGTGRLGNGAVLIKGHDFIPDGVYELTSKHMHRVDAFIPESVLKRQGIKKSSKVTDMSKIAGKTIADLPSTPRRDITPDDERIAAGDLTDEEKANIEEGRANSPLANLPAGYEVDNPAEVEQLLRNAGVDLEGAAEVGKQKSGFDKPATEDQLKSPELDGYDRIDSVNWQIEGDGKVRPAYVNVKEGDKVIDDKGKIKTAVKVEKSKAKNTPGNFNPTKTKITWDDGSVTNTESSQREYFNGDKPQAIFRKKQEKAPTPTSEVVAPKTPEAPTTTVKKESKLDDYSQQMVDDLFAREEGKTPAQINRTIKALHNQMAKYGENDASKELLGRLNKLVEDKGGKPFDPKEASENKNLGFDEVTDDFDKQNKQQRWEKNYEGGQILLEVAKGSDGKYGAIVYSGTDRETGSWAREDVLDVTDGKDIFKEADKLINDTLDADAKNEALIEKAIKDAMAGESVDPDQIIKKSAPTPIGKGFNFEEDDNEEPKKTGKASKAKKTPEGEPPAENPVKQETISLEELDALAKPEEFEKYFGFVPSEEQTRIIAAIVRSKKNTAVRAGAGAGKTTTYVGIAKALMEEDPDARIALLQLNRTNADEAAKVVPSNTISNTVDAYFGRPHIVAMAQAKTGKLKGTANAPQVDRFMSKSNFHISGAKDLANHFLMDEMSIGGENYDAAKVGSLVKSAVDKFSRGVDTKVGPQHFGLKTKVKKGEVAEDIEITPENLKKLVGYAEAYWEDLNHVPVWDEMATYKKKDGTTGKKFTKGVTAISPTHAFKMWALSNPDLSKLKSEDGKPITHMFLDEAQDTNAVFEKVINDNIDRGTAPLIAMVGDRAQSIYAFRGSRDALTTFAQKRAGADLTLTTTRRFGEDLLPNANGFLNLLGEEYRLKSDVGGGEILDNDDISKIPDAKGNTAVQTRTNAGVFEQIEKYDQMGYTVGVTEKMYQDLTEATTHLEWLSQDFNSRPKNPPKFSQDFTGMRSIKDLIRDAETEPQSRAGFWWRLIQEDPEANIKKLKDLAEKVIVEREQLDIASVTNLKANDGASGAFNGIAWSIEGDTIILTDAVKYALFSALPGREDKNFRQAVIGQKENVSKKTKALEPDLKFSDGTTPEWRTKKNGEQWLNTLVVSDDAMREDYLNKMASLFMAATEAPVIPDILVSTAHRFKGLEKDNILIGPDFPNPELDEKGKLVMPSKDEFQLGYTAVTRPRKRIFYGSLSYGLDYTGENGMRKANQDLEREPNLGVDVVKREAEAQAKLTEKRNGKPKGGTSLKSGQGQNFKGGFSFSEDDEAPSAMEQIVAQNPLATTTVPVKRSTSPSAPGKKVVDGWAVLQDGTYSSRVDGTTWNIRENKDGTIVARPRTNEDKLGSFKFNSWEQLENNFPAIQTNAVKANRDTLKEKIKPFDVNGDIAKAIDNGADPDDIVSMISKTDEFSDAIENGDVNFVSIFAAVDNVGSSKLNKPNPKTAKPKNPAPKKAPKPTPVVNSDYYNMYPNNHMAAGAEFSIFDNSIVPLESMLKLKTKSTADDAIKALVDFGGKINPDSSVTLYSKTTEETSGPRKGSKVHLEMRWTPNKATSGTHSYIVTDLETGEKTEYWDRSVTQSFNRILTSGKRRLDTYWLRDPETLPSNQNPDTYGGIHGAVNAMRTGFTQASARKGAGGLARLLEDKTASDTNILLRTPLEHVTMAMNGRDSRLNNSKDNWHTFQKNGVVSIFDAIEQNDIPAAIGALREYVNNIPNTPEAQKIVKDYLRNAAKRQLPDMSPNKLNAMLDDAFDTISSSDPIPTSGTIRPHLSRNGVLMKPGQKVRWRNNTGGEVVGEVDTLVPYDNPDAGRRTYADFVDVSFKDREATVRLNTKNMSVVDDDTEVTGYQPWLREQDLAQERAELREWTYDPETNKYYNKGVEVKDIKTWASSGPGYAESITDSAKKSIKDVAAGDVLYDDSGNLYGKVSAIKNGFGTDDSGNKVKGFKVSFEPQDNQPDMFFPSSEDVNIPKPKEVGPKTTTTSKPEIAAAARDLGLAPNADGTSSGKKITTHPTTENPDTNTPIKGSSKKAIKPTDEANEILDKQLAVGEQAWNETEPRIIDELNEMGYNIKPGTKYEDLDKTVAAEYMKKLKARDKASTDLGALLTQEKNDVATKQAAIAQKMTADGLYDANGVDFKALSKKLKEAGLEDYSYEISGASNDVDGSSAQIAGMAAYQILTDPRKKSQASRLWRSSSDKQTEFNQAKRAKSEFENNLSEATKNATKKTLEDLGVEFDNVSLDEFNGNILSVQDNKPLSALSTFKAARAFRAAFDYMPSNRIRQLAKHLEDNNKKLKIIHGVKRGHFTQTADGNYEITMSTAKGTKSNDSTALHELQHFLDLVDKNGNVAAHAWLHRRATNPDGQSLRPVMTWGKGETGFAITDLKSPYTTRRYEKGEFVLDPNFDGNEVNSTIMEDLFLDAGSVSRPNGQYAIVKKTRDKKNRKTGLPVMDPATGKPVQEEYYDFAFDPFHDKDTDKWYTDETMTEELNVRDFYGRKKSAGLDRNVKHYGMGMVLMMNDWSATTGLGE